MNLYEHGIHTERSDYRIHVGFNVKKVYVFPTKSGIEAMQSNNYDVGYATQPGAGGYATGRGYKVPWRDIKGCQEIPIPLFTWERFRLISGDSTSIKGQKAVRICMEMFRQGLIPISLTVNEVKEEDLQLLGQDLIIVSESTTVQVKCDVRCGGDKANWPKWTGNLFLQTHERNPFGMY